jgi:Fur family ferric uptake transcriptional regulator
MEQGALDRLNEFIRKKGLRRTPQRDAIVRLAFAEDEHFTSEELYDRVRRHNLDASRATVYRTITLLVDAGLLREIDLGGDLKTYDPNFLDKPSHNHLVCIDCGKVTEFEDQHVDLLNDCVTRRLGFRPVRSTIKIEACCEQLRLNGSCPNLLNARLNRKRLPASRH